MHHHIRTAAAVATAIFAVTLTACSNSSGGSSGGDIATVNDQHVTKAAFDNRLESSPTAKQVLTQLVQQALIEQYAKDQKIDIPQSDVDKKEADIKSKYPPGQFAQILQQQGLTEADVQAILRDQLIIQKAVDPNVHVTDADIAAYFAKNHASMDKPAQVRARHILVADEKTADMIEAKLKAGGNFADLAKQYSTDPSTKDKGGELGFFGPGQMVPAFQAAAFALPVGATSAPVKSPFGWHIIQVEEKKPPLKATLAGSTAQIKDTLTQQQEQQQIPTFLNGLRAKANIQISDPRFADLFPPPLPPPPAAAAPAAPPAQSAPAPAKT
jgi:foldase protein PrsA